MSAIRTWVLSLSGTLFVLIGLFLAAGPSVLGPALADITNPGGAGSCKVYPYFYDENKEVNGAFGPALTSAITDEAGLRAEIQERRSCGADGLYDPALLGSHYVYTANATLPDGTTPANLTSIKVSWDALNPFIEQLATNIDLAKKVMEELNTLEDGTTFSTESVGRGTPSLFMVANDQSAAKVTVKHGTVSNDGTNVVFTYANGATVKYRVECGAQPNFITPPPGVPECVGEECAPPPVCPLPNTTPWPECNNLKWVTPTTTEPGWDQRGLDDGVSDGQLSADQITSGETRGNAGTDQTSVGTSGTTGQDTSSSSNGGAEAEGATKGGDDQTKGEVDTENTISDPKGTGGATCQPNPALGITCPAGG